MNGVQAAVIGGSAMILLVLALRLFLKKYLPRGIFPALWCAAAVRLLLPVAIPARLSVWNLLRTPAAAEASGVISDALTPFPALATDSAAEQASQAAGISPLLLIWLVCTMLLAAYFAIGYVCMVRRFRAVRLAPPSSIDALLARFQVSHAPRICVSNSRRAPLTYGVFRPTILLPEDLPVGDAQFQLVLAHELAHIRRKDCLRKLLLTVCLCLYWWNPLVWLMVRLANCDLELACDEAVLRVLGPESRKAYALTLLDMAQRTPKPAPLCSSFAKSSVEERIRAILSFKRVPAWAGILVSALFLLSASVLATQAASPAVGLAQEMASEEAARVQTAESLPAAAAAETESKEPPQTEQANTLRYIWPLENSEAIVTDTYGYRTHASTGQESFHAGVDFAADYGTNVLAVADGTVLDCREDPANGSTLTLEHADGVQTQYAHLSEFLVEAGDAVRQGQIIAKTGDSGWATGPHLHLNVLRNGEAVDPLEALKSK